MTNCRCCLLGETELDAGGEDPDEEVQSYGHDEPDPAPSDTAAAVGREGRIVSERGAATTPTRWTLIGVVLSAVIIAAALLLSAIRPWEPYRYERSKDSLVRFHRFTGEGQILLGFNWRPIER